MDTEKKENKEVNKLSLLIVAVIVLVLIIAGAGYYIYHQKQQMTDLVETFDLEKDLWRMNIMNCLFNMKVISLA